MPVQHVVGSQVEDRPLQLAFEAPAGGEIKLFARRSFAPLVDAAEPDGGILSVVIARALENAGYEPFLSFLDEDGGADDLRGVKFPYPQDPEKKASYLYSVPIVSVTAVAAMRRDADLSIDGIADLAGLRICSDEAMLAQALHAARQAGVTGVDGVGKRIVTCFDDLLGGVFDVVLADPELTAAILERPEIDRLLSTGAGAIDLGTLHAIMPRFSPYSSAMMYHLNNALTEMTRSGAVAAIMSAGLDTRISTVGGPLLEPESVPAAATALQPAAEPLPPAKGRSEPLRGATM